MMVDLKKQAIHQILCFCTSQTNSGNPAAVVENFSGDNSAKAVLAKKLNLPVTVFVSSSKPSMLEFFYPIGQMPLCLHGSLAAALVTQQLKFITASGQILTVCHQDADIYQVQVQTQVCQNTPPELDTIQTLLNLSNQECGIDLQLPYCIASVGSPKLLIPLTDLKILKKLKPNYELIKQWSIEQQVNGLYVYVATHLTATHFYARGFNPKTGNQEDAATGVAAAALASQLQKNITVIQGDVIGRSSEIQVEYIDLQNIKVGGRCKTINSDLVVD